MASAAVQHPSGHSTSFEPITSKVHDNTSSTDETKSNDVKTTLNYYKDPGDGSEPLPSYVGKPETYERPAESLDVAVHDIRGQEDKFTLDGSGFQIHHHASTEKDFLDDEKIKSEYYRETEQLLKDVTGASRIFIFDHTIRRGQSDQTSKSPSQPSASVTPVSPATSPLRGPVNRVHIDQSYPAARARVTHHLPSISSSLLSTRHQIINVWRPISTIRRDPLAVAEAGSVPESDLVPVALIYPDRRGETYTVRPNTAHKWFYLHEQTPEEVLLIKCYDSKLDGRARRVPHTAFQNGREAEVEEARESIEVRALVFHEDDVAE